MGRDDCREIRELLGLQRQKLVAGLGCLQSAGRTLARGDERGHLGAVGVEIADDRGLRPHGVLEAAHGILPTALRVRDQRLVRTTRGRRRIGGRECAIDLLDVVGDALSLGEKLLRSLGSTAPAATTTRTEASPDSSPG